MQLLKRKFGGFLAGLLLGSILCVPAMLYAQDSGSNTQVPNGVYLKLTKDFYEALKNEGSGGAKVYSNDPSSEYLKQIAVSTHFMVETNLEILKQQETMNRLLDSLLNSRKK
jgi:hypothetical protein